MDLKRINTNRRRLQDTFMQGIHKGLRGEVFIEKIIPKYGASRRIRNIRSRLQLALNAIRIFRARNMVYVRIFLILY